MHSLFLIRSLTRNIIGSFKVENVKEVYLIRHGRTRENELGILIGQSDPSLSAQGREQVQALRSIIPVPDVVSQAIYVVPRRQPVSYFPPMKLDICHNCGKEVLVA